MAHTEGTDSIVRLPDDLARAIADPTTYADRVGMHATLACIRRDYPFARAELPGYAPFWVASKHDDILKVARQHSVFVTGPSPSICPLSDLKTVDRSRPLFRSVTAMDNPEHHKYRMITQEWFTPKSVRSLEDTIRGFARKYIDRMLQFGEGFDFVEEISSHYPLMIVMSILGIPVEDEPKMLRLTREFFGKDDADMARRGAEEVGPLAAFAETVEETSAYFRDVTVARRANPTGDLATVIANGLVDGQPMGELETSGYYITVIFAGQDTSASSIAGGIWALAENTAELGKVRGDPDLIKPLVEEALRWTSPVMQRVRRATERTSVRGMDVGQGEDVVLMLPSGNRDEDVFEDADRFRVDRPENRHITFGHGVHQCLGMHLARMEMKIFFEELLPRIKTIELAGAPTSIKSNFIGGPKSVPIRIIPR